MGVYINSLCKPSTIPELETFPLLKDRHPEGRKNLILFLLSNVIKKSLRQT